MSEIELLESFDDIDALKGGGKPIAGVHVDDLLKLTAEQGASDLHLSVGLPPMIRMDGRLVPTDYEILHPRDVQRLVYDILTNDQVQWFEKTRELDFSYGVKDIGRFRVNVYRQRGSVGAAMRTIPNQVPSMEELGLPPLLKELSRKHSGLILVTGPTGSGKSTTIATMIDVINNERNSHIMTIEDPVEYLHRHKKSMVNQRELNTDTDSFENALRAVLREDPDVILIGEMRDLETIEAALRVAETGHLVFATLHTNSAVETINRIIDIFPSYQQSQVRAQLSFVLQGVLCQSLIPKATGHGRVMAMEIMIPNTAIRNLIREDKLHQIYSIMQVGQETHGMQTLNQSLASLYIRRVISFEEAMGTSSDTDELTVLIERGGAVQKPRMPGAVRPPL